VGEFQGCGRISFFCGIKFECNFSIQYNITKGMLSFILALSPDFFNIFEYERDKVKDTV
jgi:hypothetical protein